MTRKSIFYLLLSVFIMLSCKENKEKPAIEKPYESKISNLVAMPADSMLYGHLGEETGMSSLQFITNAGDTLSILLNSPSQNTEAVLLGEIRNYSDEIGVCVRNEGEEGLSLTTFLNISQLKEKWISEDKVLELQDSGKISPSQLNYTDWHIENAQLLLTGTQTTEYATTQRVDTAQIKRLDADSLVLAIPRHGIISFGKSQESTDK